jgi:hypothetical protein
MKNLNGSLVTTLIYVFPIFSILNYASFLVNYIHIYLSRYVHTYLLSAFERHTISTKICYSHSLFAMSSSKVFSASRWLVLNVGTSVIVTLLEPLIIILAS